MQGIGVDALIFGDPAVVVAVRELGITIPLHWNPETIATNWFQVIIGASAVQNVRF